MENAEKLVNFDEYCSKCKHEKLKETDIPCAECVEIPARIDSHRPEKWEEKESK